MPEPNLILNVGTMGLMALLAFLNVKFRAESAERENKRQQSEGEQREALRRLVDSTRDEFKRALDEMKNEIARGFVPTPLAAEQREQVLFRLASIETEIKNVRDRVHSCGNDISKANLLIGELNALVDRIAAIENRLTEKARRMAALESRQQSQEGILHDHSQRLHDLEKRRVN